MYDLRVLTEHDADAFRQFRLAALEESPQAFEESAAELAASPRETTAARLRASSDENFVLGAFLDERLAGTVGFYRQERAKTRHKGRVWGVHVAPEFRRRGIARALMQALLARLRRIEGLRQVSLAVATTQHAAMRLYDATGFVVYGVEPRALRIGEAFVDDEQRVLMLD